MAASFWRWLPLLGVAAVGALALVLLRPPRPLPAGAPPTSFAAGRTVADLDSLARRPHALGTPAHAQVQAYLLRRLRALGLHPRLQDTTVLLPAPGGPLTLARVQNIIARQPGAHPGGRAVLVMAHYDSQPHTPGAGDDAAAIAAILEAIRALRAGPPLAHDVEWLLTDGEEAGLLGARAYAADAARLRQRVGVALNFEGRGNAGPSLTFEVSAPNGWLIRELARAAPAPVASSLFYEAYRYLPNDTDFTPLRTAGVPGLNFAFVGGLPYYHSPADTPAHLSLASVQHHGTYLLGLVRHFGTLRWGTTTVPDETFFNPLRTWLVHYPAARNAPLVLLGAMLLVLAAGLAVRQRRLSWPGLLGGALAWLGGLLLTGLLGAGLLAAVRGLYPAYSAFYAGTFYNALAYQVALLALGLGALSWYYARLSRRMQPDALVSGALLAILGLAGGLTWAAPSAAYLLAWPLLAAVGTWGGQLLATRRAAPAAARWVGWLLALPTVTLLVPTGYLLLTVFGLGPPVLAALLLLACLWGLLLPLVLPMLAVSPGHRPAPRPAGQSWAWLPLLGVAGTVGALGWGHLTRLPTPARPQQTQLYYYLDATARRAYWVSALPQLDAWVRQVLRQPRHAPLPAGPAATPVWWQPAPLLAVAAPRVAVLADITWAGRRVLRLRLQPGQPGSTQLVQLTGGTGQPQAVRVAGLTLSPAGLLQLSRHGLRLVPSPVAGTLLEVELPAGTRLALRVLSRSLGLPPGVPPLPPAFVPAPGYQSFTTQHSQDITL